MLAGETIEYRLNRAVDILGTFDRCFFFFRNYRHDLMTQSLVKIPLIVLNVAKGQIRTHAILLANHINIPFFPRRSHTGSGINVNAGGGIIPYRFQSLCNQSRGDTLGIREVDDLNAGLLEFFLIFLPFFSAVPVVSHKEYLRTQFFTHR